MFENEDGVTSVTCSWLCVHLQSTKMAEHWQTLCSVESRMSKTLLFIIVGSGIVAVSRSLPG